LAALALIYPPFRQALRGLSLVFAALLAPLLVLVLFLGIRKMLTRPGTAQASAPSASQAEGPGTTGQVINQLRSIDWFQFEQLVALVYRKQGYAVTRRGGANPDGGIDLVLEKDGQRSAVQCKQWKTWNVGVKPVREFLGALTDAGIAKGIFITLCGYTGEAKQLAEKHGIEILNESGLAQMLESTDARFDPEALALLRDTRKFCPKCEREMVLRTAGRGPDAGKQFWGCSGYPRCWFTMPASDNRAGIMLQPDRSR
jgi:hypothetical protein